MAHKTVICYAREDKMFREELERHLSNLRRQQFIISWSDREIAPGTEWRKEIDTQLKTADLILLLISADFMSSEYGLFKQNGRTKQPFHLLKSKSCSK